MSNENEITYVHYTVKKGDSLAKIAKAHLGNAKYDDVIYMLNRGVIGSDKNKIRPGMLLHIPQPPQQEPKPEPAPEPNKLNSYQFDHVSVWGHRWVNLLRAIKTALDLAESSAAQLEASLAASSGENNQPISETSDDSATERVTASAPDSTSNVDEVLVSNSDTSGDEWIDDEDYVDDSVDEKSRPFYEVTKEANKQQRELIISGQDELFLQLEKSQSKHIRNLLNKLSHFVDLDMGEFITALTPPRWKPTPERQYPPVALLHSLAKNAAKDLEIYSQAIQQRRRLHNDSGAAVLSSQALTLFQADKLAANALAPLQPFLRSDKPVNVISYLSANMHIRQTPYDDQAILVGLPYASMSFLQDELKDAWIPSGIDQKTLEQYKTRMPFDYMAIPHEIGHYIYHFADMPHATINQFFGPKHLLPSKYSGWAEEIFADTVGCFIAGPLAVMGMQSLLVGTYEEEFLYDDGHHPIAAIRPFIMSQILRRFSEHYGFPDEITFEHAPDKLDENWWTHLKMIGIVPADASFKKHKFKFTLHANHDDNLPAHHHNNRYAKYHAEERPLDEFILSKAGERIKTTVAKLQKEVNGVVDAFIHLLLFKADLTDFKPWSLDLKPNQSIGVYEAELEKLLNIKLEVVLDVAELEPADEDRKTLYANANQFEAEKELLRALRAWGDSGPGGGWGGHP